MFLISWRGYWQELMDMILVIRMKTPMTYNLWIGDIYTPLALSILQATHPRATFLICLGSILKNF